MPYLLSILIGIDQLGAAILFNRNDFTISSLAGIVLNVKVDPSWQEEIAALKLSTWQIKVLLGIGTALNFFFPQHCQKAIASDLARATSTRTILNNQILGK